LSQAAIVTHGLDPDIGQSALAEGVELGMAPEAPSIVPDATAPLNGKPRTGFYKQKAGSADVALKPDAS
jgi:hypothetical protein